MRWSRPQGQLHRRSRDLSGLGPFLLTGLALVGSPGPNTLSLAATGAAFGFRTGLAYLAGLCLGMIGVIAIVATGLAGLALAVPGVGQVVGLLAAGYFLWLAWRIATAPPLQDKQTAPTMPRWYEGALLSLVNPKAYAAMGALFSGHKLRAGQPAADAVVKTVCAMALIVLVNLAWLAFGARLSASLRNPVHAVWINRAFAAALLVSVAWVLFG